jgi:hypothetical protein
MHLIETHPMSPQELAREEKISSHCNVLAESIASIRHVYARAEKQQKAFIETMVGAAIWYIPKPKNAWTGFISLEAIKSFHPDSNIAKPKFSEEHVYPRKVAARLLLEDKSLDGSRLLELFRNKFGRLHYITPDENKTVIRFQKDSVFTEPEGAYRSAGIQLINVLATDLKPIKKRDAATIERYLNA